MSPLPQEPAAGRCALSKTERRQLELALRSARTTRTLAHRAWLASKDDGRAARLQRVHAEACDLEREIHRTLLQHAEKP